MRRAGSEGEQLMAGTAEERDVKVRAEVYEVAMSSGTPPTIEEISQRLGFSRAEVLECLERLAAAKALVLQRDSREVLMANPFSAVPTPFAVYADERLYFGNCIWDGLGIAAMLNVDARIESSCGCCSESMRLRIIGQNLETVEGVVHFAIPAHRWWDDIVYN